ncbi:hypothetical protein BH11PSE9_BH11PSE9_32100 [soil metagenome]
MKEYRLAAWPELRGPAHRTAHARMVSDMSHRHVTVAQLVDASGLGRREVRRFIEMLGANGLIAERDARTDASLFGSRRLHGWLHRRRSAHRT